jgi:hypothetical protein
MRQAYLSRSLLQIIRRTEKKSGHELEVEAQSFRYDGKYGQIMANGSPVYGSATDTQKQIRCFLCRTYVEVW